MARNISTQDISWFLDLNNRGLLDLKPPYQRHSVWTTKERRYFLDTIFNTYPCPPLFLYKTLSDDGISTYHVVDGKQRLETIINFSANKISLSAEMQNEELAGKKWKVLEPERRRDFWNYQLAVEMLDSVDNAKVKEIFDRYNRTSKNLERQELRHAKYDGWFATYAEEEAKKVEWQRLGVVTTATTRRMKDVQFISELMLVLLKGGISGFSQEELDEYYAAYDAPMDTDPTFIEDEFIEKFEKVKTFILEMEGCGEVVSKFARTATNFYSLWCFGALENTNKSVQEIAVSYQNFMEKVSLIIKADETDGNATDGFDVAMHHQNGYALNARGASTELPQRQARQKALIAFISGVEPSNENQ